MFTVTMTDGGSGSTFPGFTIFKGQTRGVGVGVIVGGTGVLVVVGVLVGGEVFVGEGVMDGVSEGVGECVGEAVGVGVSVGSVGNGVQSPTRKQFGAGDEASKRSRLPSLAASAMIAGFKPPKTGPSQFHAPYSALMCELASPSTIEEPNIIANWPQAKIKRKINNAASSIAIARRWFSPLSCSSSELRWTFSIISHLCFA